MLQIRREQRGAQRALDVIEERLLSRGSDGVDTAERKTHQTIVIGILGELLRDLASSLDSLSVELDATNRDLVREDIAGGAGPITVRDVPRGARQLLRGAAASGGVNAVARLQGLRQLAAEDPQVRGPCVEVQVERLGRRADADGRQVLEVVGLGHGLGAALLGAGAAGQSGVLEGQRGHHALRHRLAELPVGLGRGERTVPDVVHVADLVHGEAVAVLPGGDGRTGAEGGESRCGQEDGLREGRHDDDDGSESLYSVSVSRTTLARKE